MLTLTSSTIIMIIAIALIIGWAIGRKVNKHQQAKNTRAPIGPGVPKEPHILSQSERDQVAASIRERTPKEQMKRKLPPSRRTVGR